MKNLSGSGDLFDSVLAKIPLERGHLSRISGDLDGEELVGDIDDFGAESVDEPHDVGLARRLGSDLDEHELALDLRLVGEVVDSEDVDQLVELLGDLAEDRGGAGDDDGEESLVGVEANGEGVDVESPASEHSGDPVDHPALVPDEHRYRLPPETRTAGVALRNESGIAGGDDGLDRKWLRRR